MPFFEVFDNGVFRTGTKQELHDALVAVKNSPEKRNDRSYRGICGMLKLFNVDVYCSLDFDNLCRNWPKFSGNLNYPVPPANPGETAETEFWNAFNLETMWQGEYGALRMELLDYLIEVTK